MAKTKEIAEGSDTITKQNFVKAQANYTGKEHSDLVEVTITAENPGYGYRTGQKDQVHPATAELLLKKGLISDLGTEYKRPKFDQKDVAVDA